MAIKQPYNVNTAAEAAGLAALTHRDVIMETVHKLRVEKDRLFKALGEVCSLVSDETLLFLSPFSDDAVASLFLFSSFYSPPSLPPLNIF